MILVAFSSLNNDSMSNVSLSTHQKQGEVSSFWSHLIFQNKAVDCLHLQPHSTEVFLAEQTSYFIRITLSPVLLN